MRIIKMDTSVFRNNSLNFVKSILLQYLCIASEGISWPRLGTVVWAELGCLSEETTESISPCCWLTSGKLT